MLFRIDSQINQMKLDVRPVTFDSSFRDAMQGGGRWKRFVRIEETPQGVTVSADSLFVLLWNTILGKGRFYQHSTERLQHVVQQLPAKDLENGANPFKVFCNRVVASKLKAGAVGRDVVPQAVQLLFGLRLLQNLATLTQLPFQEVCEAIAGKIRQGIQPEWRAAFEVFEAEIEKVANHSNEPLSVLRSRIENCRSEQQFELLLNELKSVGATQYNN